MNKLLALPMIILFLGCTANTELSPARNLAGEWETTFPVKFYIKTDFINGVLEDVGSEDRTMEWIISEGYNDNTVYVEITFESSNRTIISGSGYTPDVPFMSLIGQIEGTRLILATSDGTIIGEFSFTTDLIMGTWNDSWEMAYAQEVYTKTNELKLIRK